MSYSQPPQTVTLWANCDQASAGGDGDDCSGGGGGDDDCDDGDAAGPVERSCSAPTGWSCGLAYLLYRRQSRRE